MESIRLFLVTEESCIVGFEVRLSSLAIQKDARAHISDRDLLS
jgi:hypothetical protein